MLKFAIKILRQEFLKQRMKYVERQRKVSSVRNMKVKPTLEGNKVYESFVPVQKEIKYVQQQTFVLKKRTNCACCVW